MKTTINQLVLTIVVLVTFVISFGCSDVVVDPVLNTEDLGSFTDTKVKARESFSYTIDLTTQTILKVDGINGTINVQSVSGTNQVSISGEKVVSSDTYEDANSNLKHVTVEINELAGEVQVKTLQPHFSYGRTYAVNYTISVPSNLSMDVDNLNGNIKLDIPQSTSADFSASLVNGSISLQNLTLSNKVVTSKSLQGTLGDGEGMITLRTTNGNIDVWGF